MTGDYSATLLIVDDEPNVISSLQRTLRNRPFRVVGATSGADAIALMKSDPADLVICDSRMPEMDGPTVLSEIQRRWPDCMRILLTAYDDHAQTIKAINEGKIFATSASPGTTAP